MLPLMSMLSNSLPKLRKSTGKNSDQRKKLRKKPLNIWEKHYSVTCFNEALATFSFESSHIFIFKLNREMQDDVNPWIIYLRYLDNLPLRRIVSRCIKMYYVPYITLSNCKSLDLGLKRTIHNFQKISITIFDVSNNCY